MIEVSLRSGYSFDSFKEENNRLLNNQYLEELVNIIYKIILNYQEAYDEAVEVLEIDFYADDEYGSYYEFEKEVDYYIEHFDNKSREKEFKDLIAGAIICGYLISEDWQVDLKIVKG